MPRVVANQRERFENDELFRKLSRDVEIRYTSFRDRPASERRLCLQAECREGHASVAVVGIGLNLNLNFMSAGNAWERNERPTTTEYVDFDREPNKVHLKSRFILNGVCVLWRGWIDLRRLDGVGRLEFDAEAAELEEALQLRDSNGFNDALHHNLQQQQQPLMHHQQQQPPSIDVISTYPPELATRVNMSAAGDHHHQQSPSQHRPPVTTNTSTRPQVSADDRQFQRMQRQLLTPESQTANVDKHVMTDFSISSVTSSSTTDARYVKRFSDVTTK